ncbi:PIG-L deacetylase family protein [Brachybacterium sp. AOP25-B2-12]|uniref:PIG-L deacetylase family protein n=1 Tax=Brachybacterium sp. AOP25-B2-12 TaxID=3457710 RepID=UPI0040339454
MRRLVLSPHMDDESMGCGGLLAKHPDECTVAVAADSGDVRRREFTQAMAVLGVTRTVELGMEDGYLDRNIPALVGAVDDLCREHRPEELYLPFPSLQQDHIAVYEAGMRAARLSMTPGHWSAPQVFVYDVAVYDVNLYPTDLRWNVFEPLSREQAELKAGACEQYVSESPEGPHPIRAILQIAEAVGKTRGLEFAEQYALVRHVRP